MIVFVTIVCFSNKGSQTKVHAAIEKDNIYKSTKDRL